MQTTSASMAWLFLQENVQVLHEVQFSAAIEAAHFPAVETGH